MGKMKELKIVMEEMMNMTNMEIDKTTTAPTRIGESEEDMEMMSMLFGKAQAMKIKMKMKINRLQKYCFTPTDRDMQSMCAAPDMDMNIFENLELLGHSSHFIRNTLNVTVDVEIQHVMDRWLPQCEPINIKNLGSNKTAFYPSLLECGDIIVSAEPVEVRNACSWYEGPTASQLDIIPKGKFDCEFEVIAA